MSTQQDGTWQPPTQEEAAADPQTTENQEGSSDPEALGGEREEYPDPESYPSSHGAGADVTDGETPDADLQVDAEEP